MCGRFTLQIPAELLAELFGLPDPSEVPARFNIAPTQQVAVIRQRDGGGNRLDFLKWGLIPSWAKAPSIGPKMINARSETLEEKPAFRSAFKLRRCLVPASGFYEWEVVGGKKIPRYFRLRGGAPMVFAALWESWRAPDGASVESCAILTTAANALVEPLHLRMPVILHSADFSSWLDGSLTDPGKLKGLLQPYPAEGMEGWTVSTLANSVKNDHSGLIEPVVAPTCG
jgi:putative SOS response-associated peptidase YedK